MLVPSPGSCVNGGRSQTGRTSASHPHPSWHLSKSGGIFIAVPREFGIGVVLVILWCQGQPPSTAKNYWVQMRTLKHKKSILTQVCGSGSDLWAETKHNNSVTILKLNLPPKHQRFCNYEISEVRYHHQVESQSYRNGAASHISARRLSGSWKHRGWN